MHKRFVATTVLAAALLFSQGASFLVAALCPHLASGMVSCETEPSRSVISHDGMAHEEMGHMGHMGKAPDRYPNPDPHSNSVAIGQTHGPCTHCAVHSRPTPRAASLRETEAARRALDLSIPIHCFRVAPVSGRPIAVLSARAHGPPGEARPRHILINIFRI